MLKSVIHAIYWEKTFLGKICMACISPPEHLLRAGTELATLKSKEQTRPHMLKEKN